MARKSRKRRLGSTALTPPGATPPLTGAAFPFAFIAPVPVATEQRSIVSAKDGWSEFTLDDGTILRVKSVLVDAKRVPGQYTPDGDPLYMLQVTNVVETKAPTKLRRPITATAKKSKS